MEVHCRGSESTVLEKTKRAIKWRKLNSPSWAQAEKFQCHW